MKITNYIHSTSFSVCVSYGFFEPSQRFQLRWPYFSQQYIQPAHPVRSNFSGDLREEVPFYWVNSMGLVKFCHSCPKLCWLQDGVKLYGQISTWRAGHLDQVILLVWPRVLTKVLTNLAPPEQLLPYVWLSHLQRKSDQGKFRASSIFREIYQVKDGSRFSIRDSDHILMQSHWAKIKVDKFYAFAKLACVSRVRFNTDKHEIQPEVFLFLQMCSMDNGMEFDHI